MTGVPKEVQALGAVLAALKNLDDDEKRVWVITSAASNLNLVLPGGAGGGGGARGGGGGGVGAGGGKATSIAGEPGSREHARGFLRQKAPANGVQQVAVLAYYLTHFRATAEFDTAEITAMNTEAGGQTIGNASQTVKNALQQSGFLSKAGEGKKQLSAYGEEVVDALPDQEAVKNVPVRKPRRGKAKKGKSKASA